MAALLSLAALVPAFSPQPSGAGEPGASVGACTIASTRELAPSRLDVGEETLLTTTLQVSCPVEVAALHLVLIVDSSEQMMDRGQDWLSPLLSVLEAGVRGIELDDGPRARIGVVSFRDRVAVTECRLTNDPDEVASALHNISLRIGANCPQCGLREALRKARRMLQAGRSETDASRDVILIASRGFDPLVCDAVRAATNEVGPFGIQVVTVCGGEACDRRCLSEAASQPRFAFSAGNWQYVGVVLTDLLERNGPFRPVLAVGYEERLGNLVEYVGGGKPDRAEGSWLSWAFEPSPGAAMERVIRLRAARPGAGPVSVDAWAWLQAADWVGRPLTDTVSLDRPMIEVIDPASPSTTPSSTPSRTPGGSMSPSPETPPGTPSATPSATQPTATVTPPGAPTPTPSATPHWATTDGRPREHAYLPMVLAGSCPADARALDVVFLIDVSGSMGTADVPPFENRWAAAGAVSEEIVRYHAGQDDRFAVVPFGAVAGIHAPLGADRAAVLAALANLPKWDGSRMDLALETARAELERGRRDRPAAWPVIVLVTDGDLNQAQDPEIQAVARSVRAWGARIHAVGLGDQADPLRLARAAGARSRVYLTAPGVSPLLVADAVGRNLHCVK